MANFQANSTPQLGDVAAGRGSETPGYLGRSIGGSVATGHTGIVVQGEVVVSANPTQGVRVLALRI